MQAESGKEISQEGEGEEGERGLWEQPRQLRQNLGAGGSRLCGKEQQPRGRPKPRTVLALADSPMGCRAQGHRGPRSSRTSMEGLLYLLPDPNSSGGRLQKEKPSSGPGLLLPLMTSNTLLHKACSADQQCGHPLGASQRGISGPALDLLEPNLPFHQRPRRVVHPILGETLIHNSVSHSG